MTPTSTTARIAVFAPLDSGGRVEAVTERLRGAIALGLIGEGEQLPRESELANALGVSTVTLRAALSRLRHLGMVETRRGRGGGSFARPPTDLASARIRRRLRETGAHQLRDLGDTLVSVSTMAARRAAERASPTEVRRLTTLVDALARARTPAECWRADGRFHVEMAAAAQSVRLTGLELALQDEFGELLWYTSSTGSGPDGRLHAKAVAEHRTILQAVEAGDVETAREVAELHVEQAVEHVLDMHYLADGG